MSSNCLYKWKSLVDSTSLSHFEEMYQAIQSTSHPTINDHILVALETYHLPYWLETPPYIYYILHTLPSNETIMEVMSLDEIPWKHHHHRSSFLPNLPMVEDHFGTMVSSDIVTNP